MKPPARAATAARRAARRAGRATTALPETAAEKDRADAILTCVRARASAATHLRHAGATHRCSDAGDSASRGGSSVHDLCRPAARGRAQTAALAPPALCSSMHRATACAAGRLLVTQRRVRQASAPIRVAACAVPPAPGRSGREAPPVSTNGILVRLRGARPARQAAAMLRGGARPDAASCRPAALVGPPRCSAGGAVGAPRSRAQRGAGGGAAASRRGRKRATCCHGCALLCCCRLGGRGARSRGFGGFQERTRCRYRRPPARCLAGLAPRRHSRFG